MLKLGFKILLERGQHLNSLNAINVLFFNACFILLKLFYISREICKKIDSPPRKKNSRQKAEVFLFGRFKKRAYLPNFFWCRARAFSTAAFAMGSIIL